MKAKFSELVEEYVAKKHMTYMDAALEVCENHNIEPQDVKKYLSTPIKNKIEAEARKLNFLPKITTLPIE